VVVRDRFETAAAGEENHVFRTGLPPRLARNTVIQSTFEVGRRFHCTMRIDWSQLEPGAVTPAGTRGAAQGPTCPLPFRRYDLLAG
jgi:hypothetical protein